MSPSCLVCTGQVSSVTPRLPIITHLIHEHDTNPDTYKKSMYPQ